MLTTDPVLRDALAEVRRELDRLYGDRLVRVVLYGSRARGDARPDSDVDVLVVLRGAYEAYTEIKRMSPLTGEMMDRYDLLFSMQPFSEDEAKDLRRPLMQSVQAEGIEL